KGTPRSLKGRRSHEFRMQLCPSGIDSVAICNHPCPNASSPRPATRAPHPVQRLLKPVGRRPADGADARRKPEGRGHGDNP
ncbi:MAG: hypothetical protein OXD36_15330, partial [Rhodobacter sp.]|nr:hypothetical protein [Rhodobacter sp.]